MVTTESVDIAIVGGGMVGMATAIGLANAGFQVGIVDRAAAQPVSGEPRLRVSAINRASEQWLRELGAWQLLPKERLSPYNGMQVWDKDNLAGIEFHAEDLAQPDLGHIVENDTLAYALWQRAEQTKGIKLFVATPQGVAVSERDAWLNLDNGTMLTAQLVLAADGANSWLRQQCQIPLSFRDYGHHALVGTVRTQQPHGGVARQVFLPDGPLALLPLNDPNLCSIVWSQSPAQAEQRAQLTADEFNLAISVATESRLGHIQVESARPVFPLMMRYARDFVRPRIALMGDAAHTIHPLAGQGVNLGFGDSIAMVQLLSEAKGSDWDIGAERLLKRYERRRQAAAQEMLVAMDGFRWLFAGTNPLKQMVRGLGMNLVDKAGSVKNQLLSHALGLSATNNNRL
ncbi:FAD-dependent monooxygenase [Ferrimonas lipolytica]|uniref:FAD-dependent 2-octaprenylphenol hydroxylase n=1 Tax=Ferrimonas lipolytica TaxID=2724191 RepID=A0A6H1UEZ4_9GAMM|nr:FAD-dependent monooxygenase [Ferrimonas lipolytica]QIZ77665.1 FAD-dependent 2-octaprenylphenol hydroxylase [Ferrimonas lipolytica]